MNKILKILSILIIGFVMFSCSTPTNNPETPVETPSDDPVEETPKVQTYSVIFTTAKSNHKIITDYLNSLPEFKNLKEGTEVTLYNHIYLNEACTEITTEIVETSVYDYHFCYNNNNSEIDSVIIGNEDVKVEVIYKDWSKLE